jgi:hypothetical protein
MPSYGLKLYRNLDAPAELNHSEVATMTHLVFTIVEEATGWFVHGADRLGPFYSKQRAYDLAEGMVSAIRACGEEAELVVEARSWSGSRPIVGS